jgi:hypothetical protein
MARAAADRTAAALVTVPEEAAGIHPTTNSYSAAPNGKRRCPETGVASFFSSTIFRNFAEAQTAGYIRKFPTHINWFPD